MSQLHRELSTTTHQLTYVTGEIHIKMTYVITGARDYNQTVNLGESVVFDASSSVDDEEIISYRWDFGDGTNGSGKIVSHSYAEAETYQMRAR